MTRELGQSGFTLLELLVSLSIIAIIFAAQAGPFAKTIESRDQAERTIEATAAARTTLERLAEEITGAIPASDERGGFKVVDRSFEFPSSEIRFATTAARRLRGDLIDPVSYVRYRVDEDPYAPGTRVLIKEQLPSVAAPGVEPVSGIIIDNITSFEVQVLTSGVGEWRGTWDATQDREDLPRAVRLALSLDDGSLEPPVFRLTVALPMGPTR